MSRRTIDVLRVHGGANRGGASSISLASGERLLHDARLDELERMLPRDFIRVHRCHIVNTAHLVRVRALASGQRVVESSDGAHVPLSRRRARAVLAALTRASSSKT